MKKQLVNPYLPGYEYIPDAEPRLFGDRVYIYGSHDAFGGEDYCVNDYVCWSAPAEDLSDWRYEGVIYTRSQDPQSPGVCARCRLPTWCRARTAATTCTTPWICGARWGPPPWRCATPLRAGMSTRAWSPGRTATPWVPGRGSC